MLKTNSSLPLGVIGINHKTGELALREAMARSARILGKGPFSPFPTVVLSTCNRTEIYFSGEDLAEIHSQILSLFRPSMETPFEHRLYSFFGIDAFSHLAKVTSGLDSAIVGESDIQGQVKRAYLTAAALHLLPSSLHYIFQKSLKIGKLVRQSFQAKPTALAEAIWTLAKHHRAGNNLLFVGYSHTNRKIASFLSKQGLSPFSLATRDPSKVVEPCFLAQDRSILSAWPNYDWIIAAASSDSYLIAPQKGPYSSLIFDLSLPRNVDPLVGRSATLYNLEEIHRHISASVSSTNEPFVSAEKQITEQVLRLTLAYREKTAQRGGLSFCSLGV